MKRTILTLAVAALAVIVSSQAMAADATAKAGVGATIVVPIAIEKAQDLEFGSIAPGLSDGTVSVSTDDVRTGSGDLNLLSVGNTPQAAGFVVMGSPEATYTITLPKQINVLNEAGTEKMAVDEFTSNPDGAGVLDAKGRQSLKVGATLHVAASQAAGRYTGNFAVTVEYN
jgi:spore coat protein U-like protein